MRITKCLALLLAVAGYAHPTFAAPIACATGDLAKYGTTVKSIPGVPDHGVTSTGEINEGNSSVHMISLATIKRNQAMINSELERTSGKIKVYCSGGLMGNEADCSYSKKEFLDIFAWAYNTETPIDCKYTKLVSHKTQSAIAANPISYLKRSRFDCGSNGDQLCCANCLKTGFASESAGW